MELLGPSLTSLINTVVSLKIDTGNRLIDTAIIGVVTAIIAIISGFIKVVYNSYEWKNWFLMIWYRKSNGLLTADDVTKQKYYTGYSQLTLINYEFICNYGGNNIIRDYLINVIKKINKGLSKDDIKLGGGYPIAIYNGYYIYIRIMRESSYDFGIFRNKDEVYDKITRDQMYTKLNNILVNGRMEYEKTLDISSAEKLNIYSLFERDKKSNEKGAISGTGETGSCIYDIGTLGQINQKKTFNTLYFDSKEILISTLDKFANKTMYPIGIGMENKIGIMLYGPPGTGKTGTISAIANKLKRNILLINNLPELIINDYIDKLFTEERDSQYIYVIDEFEKVMKICSTSGEREEKEGSEGGGSAMGGAGGTGRGGTKHVDYATMLAVAEGEERGKILEMMRSSFKKDKEKKRFDYGIFLQKLDGIESAENRCIIYCTNDIVYLKNNFRELFRPGRIDLELHLDYCSAKMYEDILIAALNISDTGEKRLAIEKIRRATIPEKKWSPVAVINMALVHKSLDIVLDKLLAPK